MADAPFDYAQMQALAVSLLTQFGQAISIRRATATGGTAWEPTTSSADFATIGIITDLARWYSAFTGNNDVLRTDRAGLVAASPLDALGIVPTANDLLVDQSGTVWKIMDVKPVYPGGVNVIYKFQLRV